MASTLAIVAVDYSSAVSQTTILCFKSNRVNMVIPRAWRSDGSFDPNVLNNILAARNAGITYLDIYMFPCRGMSATNQVNDLIA